jgi:hypothetical protein
MFPRPLFKALARSAWRAKACARPGGDLHQLVCPKLVNSTAEPGHSRPIQPQPCCCVALVARGQRHSAARGHLLARAPLPGSRAKVGAARLRRKPARPDRYRCATDHIDQHRQADRVLPRYALRMTPVTSGAENTDRCGASTLAMCASERSGHGYQVGGCDGAISGTDQLRRTSDGVVQHWLRSSG